MGQDTLCTYCCQHVAASTVVAMPAVAAESIACAAALHLLLCLLMLLLPWLLLYMCAAVLAVAVAACIDAFQCTAASAGVLLHVPVLLLLCMLSLSRLQLPFCSCCHNCCCLCAVVATCAVALLYGSLMVHVL